MGIKISLIAEYSGIFPDSNETIENLLTGIPRDLLLKAGTTFLLSQTVDHKNETWLEIISWWFSPNNIQFKEDIVSRIGKNYKSEKLANLSVITPISSLKLIQCGLTQAEDGPIKGKLQIEIDIFKIYLLLNELFVNLQVQSSEYIERMYPDIKTALWFINTRFSTTEFTNFRMDREYFCQTVKFLFLYRFLKNEEELSFHLKELCGYYGVSSIEDYYGRVKGFIEPMAHKKKEGFIELQVRNEEDNKFLSRLSVQEFSKDDDIDFRVVRSAPLIQVANNAFRITDPIFITDKLYKSLYFDLNRINNSIGDPNKISNFRSFYTSTFSEKFLLYEVLKYCLKERYIQFSGNKLAEMKIEGAPDYYVRNGKYIFLIENKDVLFSGKIKDPPSENTKNNENSLFERIEMELKKKFMVNEKGKRVGIAQILDNIEKILIMDNKFDKNYKPKKIVIFPILIVHDIVYDCPGLNTLFNNWFQEEVTNLRDKKNLPTNNIKPLIILNIDSLIRCAELLRVGKLSLKDLMEVYYDNSKIHKRNFTSQEEMRDTYTKTYLSSTEIIEGMCSSNEKYAYLFRNNRILEYAFNICKL